MNKEVTLFISGLHMADNGEDNVDIVADGQYFYKNGSHYIIYNEKYEGFDEPAKSRIKIKSDCLEIKRQGIIEVFMVFEKGKTHISDYRFPYGTMMVGIHTTNMKVEEIDGRMFIKVEYSIEIDGVHQADSSIKIKIEDKKI
jgi:uncharacterized beta-barrel protein YwiB (DUF1934 family)